MVLEDELTFTIESIVNPPLNSDIPTIAFIPKKGFHSCVYFNGSKTWQQVDTRETVYPTYWLKLKY